MFDGVEVANFNWSPHETDHSKREKWDLVKTYEAALSRGSPRAIIERAHACRKRGIELAVEDTVPVVVAFALIGDWHRYAKSRERWKAQFVLHGRPPPDQTEAGLAAACLDAVARESSVRYAALGCLARLMASRHFDITSNTLANWGARDP